MIHFRCQCCLELETPQRDFLVSRNMGSTLSFSIYHPWGESHTKLRRIDFKSLNQESWLDFFVTFSFAYSRLFPHGLWAFSYHRRLPSYVAVAITYLYDLSKARLVLIASVKVATQGQRPMSQFALINPIPSRKPHPWPAYSCLQLYFDLFALLT